MARVTIGSRRARATAAALASASLIATGCGSGSSPTKAQALSFAEQTNLRAGDVAGDRTIGHVSPFNGVTLGVVINRCGADLPSSDERAVAISPNFVQAAPGADLWQAYRRGHIYSTVYVLRSDALAKRAAEALAAPRTRACMYDYWASHHKSSAVRMLRVRPLTLGPSGARIEGIRETGRVAARARTEFPSGHFQIDTLGFARGQAVVRLTVTSTEAAPSAAIERRLLEALMRRSERQRL